MLIRSPNGTFEHIDFRETAPNASTKDMFVNDPSLAQIGGLSVAVPYVFFVNFSQLKSLIFS
jgi:gamma-glutamyltranspeptidase/glutathione hydrolase/leukotriene-C4 hydrolase